MQGSKIIKLFTDSVNAKDPGLMKTVQVLATKSQMEIYDIHSRAVGCHCECMCMDSENVIAVMNNGKPPYGMKDYHDVMEKWRLVDDKARPII